LRTSTPTAGVMSPRSHCLQSSIVCDPWSKSARVRRGQHGLEHRAECSCMWSSPEGT
jgi:hypothetical protein